MSGDFRAGFLRHGILFHLSFSFPLVSHSLVSWRSRLRGVFRAGGFLPVCFSFLFVSSPLVSFCLVLFACSLPFFAFLSFLLSPSPPKLSPTSFRLPPPPPPSDRKSYAQIVSPHGTFDTVLTAAKTLASKPRAKAKELKGLIMSKADRRIARRIGATQKNLRRKLQA